MTEDPLIGRRLANFQIERPLGRGGMAQVYYGQDVKLRRPVAIKVIDARYRDKPAYAERFVREAQAIASWRHEHIIHIHYADDEDGFYYYVMEYIDGLDLDEMLAQYKAKNKLISRQEVLRIAQAIAAALDYAHKLGIIHRDIKPSNIMIAHDGRIVLTDFGLAMDVELGSMGEVFGSARYIAPEQARRSADALPQSDLYSFGIILYEMLTGRVPFDDPSSTAVAVQHMTLPPPPPREINPDLNVETEAVLLKALQKSPQDRYQSGAELLEAMEKALQIGFSLAQGATELSRQSPPEIAKEDGQDTSDSPASDSSNTRPFIYLGIGIGVALIVMVSLAILLFGLFFLNRGSGDDEKVVEAGQVVTTEAEATSVGVESVTATVDSLAVSSTPTLPVEETPPVSPTILPPPTVSPTILPTPTSTPAPAPQLLADTKHDFSDSQGKWFYRWAPPGTNNWNQMQYESRKYGNCWYAQDYIRICEESAHPGNGADIAWFWTSDVSGALEVQIRAGKIDIGGDGVVINVYRTTTNTADFSEFTKTLAGHDGAGFAHKFEIDDIVVGDYLFFVMQRNGSATSDHTAFQATICHYSCP